MTDRPMDPLDERKEQILRFIIEGYVRTGEPVASKTVADLSDLGVSSATIRNEMGALESEGYITHPHTSAGRMPTDKGYRHYVDSLGPRLELRPQQRAEIERFLLGTLTALDDLLRRASDLLAELTEYASLASAPPAAEGRVRQLQLVSLGGTRLFLIVVGSGGWHEERVLDLREEPEEGVIGRALEVANRVVEGRTLAEAADALEEAEVSADLREVLEMVVEGLRVLALKSSRLYTRGTSRVVVWGEGPEARRVLELLEEGDVEPLMLDPEPEEIAVRIGRELGLRDLRDLSLIATGYRFGRRVGGVGVLGPTRMDYPRVISTVAEVARSLSEALRQLESS